MPETEAFARESALRAVTDSLDDPRLRLDTYDDSIDYDHVEVTEGRYSSYIAHRKITLTFRGKP